MNWIAQYIEKIWLEKGNSAQTLDAYRGDLKALSKWLEKKNTTPDKASCDDIRCYLKDRCQLSARSVARKLSCFRGFYQWLQEKGVIVTNPLTKIGHPKVQIPLPITMDEGEVEALLLAPDLNQILGLRDRTILELMYATGLRISEVLQLKLSNINFRQGLVRVLGKGSKERLVPLGETALEWLQHYLTEARPKILAQSGDLVFFNRKGCALTRQALWHRIKRYARQIGLKSSVSPHSLRHAFATHLINHGADLRAVQMMLGHNNLSTTQIYTQISQSRLHQIHKRHHPRG